MRKSVQEYSGSCSPYGLDNYLKFCDTCLAAEPVKDFPTHICAAAPSIKF